MCARLGAGGPCAILFQNLPVVFAAIAQKEKHFRSNRGSEVFSFSWFEQPTAFSEPPRFPTIQTIKRIGLHVVGMGLALVVEADLFLSLAMLLSLSACGEKDKPSNALDLSAASWDQIEGPPGTPLSASAVGRPRTWRRITTR